MLGGTARFQITVLIGEAHHRIGVADIDPLRIGARRIEVDPERPLQARGERGRLFRLAVGGDAAEHADFAQLAFRDEKITIRRSADKPRLIEAGCVQFDLESRGNFWPGVFRACHHLRAIASRCRCERSGQILKCDLASRAGLLKTVVGKRRPSVGAR